MTMHEFFAKQKRKGVCSEKFKQVKLFKAYIFKNSRLKTNNSDTKISALDIQNTRQTFYPFKSPALKSKQPDIDYSYSFYSSLHYTNKKRSVMWCTSLEECVLPLWRLQLPVTTLCWVRLNFLRHSAEM